MIEIKKENEKDYKLYDTKTEKFVEDNADNRAIAMFGILLKNKIESNSQFAEDFNNIAKLASKYEDCLARTIGDPINDATLGAFLYSMNNAFKLDEALLSSEYFEKFTKNILNDQRNEKTRTNYIDLAKDFAYLSLYNYKEEEMELN